MMLCLAIVAGLAPAASADDAHAAQDATNEVVERTWTQEEIDQLGKDIQAGKTPLGAPPTAGKSTTAT